MPEELQGAELVSAQFFDLLRKPQLDSAILDATIEKIRELCPRVENFSFELVDGEETARAEGETSRVTVEASTPQSTVDAWNSVKLVGLFVLRGSVVCGAAIGSVKRDALDFKACALPVDGEDACPYAAHRLKSALRINYSLVGDFDLCVPVPCSAAGGPVQVFSRPLLSASDLYYMGPGTVGYKRLLALKMEPRCWKFVLDNFPGRDFLKEPGQPGQASVDAKQRAPLVQRVKTEFQGTPMQPAAVLGPDREVTDQPIMSPKPKGGTAPASSQLSVQPWDDKWSDQSHRGASRSQASRRDPEETGSVYSTLVTRTNRSRGNPRTERRRVEPTNRVDSDLSDEDEYDRYSNIRSFRDVGSLLRRLELKHESVTGRLREDLQAARRRITELETDLVASSKEPEALTSEEVREMMSTVDDAAFQAITGRVFTLMRTDPSYVSRADVEAIAQTAGDSNLVQRVDDLEKDVYHSAGSVPKLLERVEHLETARAATAIELGGYVFTDDSAVDAWLRSFNDPTINRFCVDFLILLLMAEPKFETVSRGLEQTAAVKKAQFESLDMATIDLSYKMVYPPRILLASEKESAMDTDNVEWAAPFVSHAAFEGTYNNGTHLRLKKSITGVVKALEGGLDAAYPPRLHPKVNAVFKDQLRLSSDQCLSFLDSCTPLQKKIAGGGLPDKECWSRVLVFVKQVFDDVAAVRAVNSEATLGSRVWASFATAHMLKVYQHNNWIEHPKTSSILAITSMRKEGKAIDQMATTLGTHTSTLQSHTAEIKKLKEEMKKKNPSQA